RRRWGSWTLLRRFHQRLKLSSRTNVIQVAQRAWYSAPVSEFLRASDELVLGSLAMHGEFALEPTQRDAWLGQLQILRSTLQGLGGAILLEYSIPRMGRRIDAVLLMGPVIFVLEFKVG